MKIAGCTLFTIGIIVAISGAAKLPQIPKPEAAVSAAAGLNSTGEPSADATSETGPAQTSPTEKSAAMIGRSAVEKARFPDTWPVFAGGFVTALLGVSLWWSDVLTQRRLARASHQTDSEDSPVSLLSRLQPALQQFESDLESLDGEQLTHRIDALLDQYVTPLAESRQKLIDQFGMSAGAEILVTAAFGERMLNRVWSAAADGHLPEARSSFLEAAEAFKQAQTLVRGIG